jgi:hypothetical protein
MSRDEVHLSLNDRMQKIVTKFLLSYNLQENEEFLSIYDIVLLFFSDEDKKSEIIAHMERHFGSVSIYSKIKLLFDKNIKSPANEQKLFITPLIVFKVIAQAILANFKDDSVIVREENALYFPSLKSEVKSDESFMEVDDVPEDAAIDKYLETHSQFIKN